MEDDDALYLSLLTTRELSSAVEGASLLRRLGVYPELAPQKCGVYDPLRTVFDASKVDEVVEEHWGSYGFNWKRKPRGEGGIIFGDARRHGTITMVIRDRMIAPAMVKYLRSEAVELAADLACISPSWPGKTGSIGPLDSCYLSVTPEKFEQVGRGYYGIELIKYLPQLAWASVFGRAYVMMFGRDRLLSAPAAVVEEIGPEMIYLQLTSKVSDIADDLPAYFDLRRRVKEHIGLDAFFDPARGKGPYRVPKFNLAPAGSPRPLGYIDGQPVTGLFAGKPIVQTNDGLMVLDKQWLPSKGD